jgi:hypothetical protein
VKEWLKVTRAANGHVVVTVSLSEDNRSARWSMRTVRGEIAKTVREARKCATEMLSELQVEL